MYPNLYLFKFSLLSLLLNIIIIIIIINIMKLNFLTITTDILLIIVVYAMFILAVIADRQYTIVNNSYNLVFFNNNLTYIEDIKTSRLKCLNNYKPMLEREKFFGVLEGCYNKKKNKYYKGKICSNSTDEVQINNFEDTHFNVFKNILMCLKRVRTKFTEANYLQVPNNENCPDNYRLCGYYNSFKDILCVKEKAHCPITYVGLETEIDHKSKKQYIDLEDGTYIAYTNETQTPLSLIPLDFTLSEGYPCWNYKRHSNITLIYPFTKHLGDFGCNPKNPTDLDKQYLDYRYIPISNVTRKLLYKDNDVYENYVDLPIPDDFTWDFETNFTLFQPKMEI